jgi:hypothetical protein
MARKDILTSIHGRRLGLSIAGFSPSTAAIGEQQYDWLTGDAIRGLLIGSTGSELAVGDDLQTLSMLDDFSGGVISSKWTLTKGSDGGCVNFAILAATLNGAVRGTTGAGAGATMAVNGVEIDGGSLAWGNNGTGGELMEVMIKPSSIATICLFIGWTNETGTLQMPVTISGVTPTANANDCAGFVFDTAATSAVTQLASCNNGGTPQLTPLTVAPDTTKFHRYRVGLDSLANANFFIDGVKVGSLPLALRTTVGLTPVVAAFTRAAGSANIDIDYIFAQQDTGRF